MTSSCASIDVFDLPEGKANSRGRPIVNLLPLEENEKISFILPIQEFSEDRYMFLATDRGTVRRTPLSAFSSARRGIRATNLGDEKLVGVTITSGDDDVFLLADNGRCVHFKETHGACRLSASQPRRQGRYRYSCD